MAWQAQLIAGVEEFVNAGALPAERMIRNLVDCEHSYINTDHPSFIGGSRAIAQACGCSCQGYPHIATCTLCVQVRRTVTGLRFLHAVGMTRVLLGLIGAHPQDSGRTCLGGFWVSILSFLTVSR